MSSKKQTKASLQQELAIAEQRIRGLEASTEILGTQNRTANRVIDIQKNKIAQIAQEARDEEERFAQQARDEEEQFAEDLKRERITREAIIEAAPMLVLGTIMAVRHLPEPDDCG